MKRDFGNWCVECAINVWRSPFGNNAQYWLRLWLILISSISSVLALSPAGAQEANAKDYSTLSTDIRQSEIEQPATTLNEWLTQIAQTAVIQITGVQANPTEQGVEVILQTTQGEQLQISDRSAGNNFIADIPNAQLRLPNGEAFVFRSEKPVEGITEIAVTNLDANTIRVTVAGETGLPTVELFDSDEGLIFGLTPAVTAMQPEVEQPTTSDTLPDEPAAQGDEPIELIVTGEQDTEYRVPNASVGTRTDTPLRDIPQSIQVVPQQVLRDQNVTRLEEALSTVGGVTPVSSQRVGFSTFIIRGFDSPNDGNFLRDGLRDSQAQWIPELSNIERIEVLRGPASVLYGGGSPGGTINLVTKQPLRDPFYAINATIGSYNFYRGTVDLSGPLNDSRTVLYRLNASYLDRDSFVDFYNQRQFSISPVFSLALGERTNLTLEGSYTDVSLINDFGLPAIGTVLPNPNGRIPRNRLTAEPDSVANQTAVRVGYRLEHQFSNNWSLQNAFRATVRTVRADENVFSTSLADDNRTLNRGSFGADNRNNDYDLAVNLIGRFSTGSIDHQLVFGVDLARREEFGRGFGGTAAPLDLFNPVYGQPRGPQTLNRDENTLTDALGIYVQDQVTLADNLRLLMGGRFDLFEETNQNFLADTSTSQSGQAFSPRIGIVYQPIEPISLYASYSRSFDPAFSTSFEGISQFQPVRGTQYEVGVKADVNDRLSAILAFYDLTRSNVITPDNRPGVPPGFSIQTGEQRSRGVELTAQGEILPGWNIIAGYAYTDARITQDNTFPVGNRLNLVPENSFNLWTTYQIQQGVLQGLGFGAGLFYVGERQGDLVNSFQVPSYLRTDAAIFYNRDRFRAALNFRNLFNVDYFESAFNLRRVYPGEPFTVQGTISWEF
ncbi:TonB-dependent siderophore receptor [Gloeocapsopsis sp. IPPAS B-1203]|uniref:TonB-dependent siderophore receptor n=1 Tax=Gloeocapsopsis sp. IPPAS B-1203 TaxID=2049454 RepID=UPI000C1A05E3|nr:TonB-dependent siderophore receptor [Gloeocapsopsis sp. IPPAS B-1203]PIG93416.1 TonB-dependent siderophore receptor [Gloeocapsopsis sp. IPPAS B-1203]